MQNFAELLLNCSLQMRVFCCNWGVSKANKTNENRSVRTGQVELANRRLQPLGHLSAANDLAICSADQAPATARNCARHLFRPARWNTSTGCTADHFEGGNDQNTGSCV